MRALERMVTCPCYKVPRQHRVVYYPYAAAPEGSQGVHRGFAKFKVVDVTLLPKTIDLEGFQDLGYDASQCYIVRLGDGLVFGAARCTHDLCKDLGPHSIRCGQPSCAGGWHH